VEEHDALVILETRLKERPRVAEELAERAERVVSSREPLPATGVYARSVHLRLVVNAVTQLVGRLVRERLRQPRDLVGREVANLSELVATEDLAARREPDDRLADVLRALGEQVLDTVPV